MYLNQLVHGAKPLLRDVQLFMRRNIDACVEFVTRRGLNHKFSRQSYIKTAEQAHRFPFLRWSLVGKSHDLTIQLLTSRLKRAATTVRPELYCTATTQASVSRPPSVLCTRSLSPNSMGNVEANKISRCVPNSMTVLSEKAVLS